ncbi:MAG TPA: YhjD/YihY/BrkB family envelope integrity protein [Gaiellaceae bacterium]
MRVVPIGQTFSKFFADRGTHLAAMVAYFALASFVPLVFLALALLGLLGRADESSFLVKELVKIFPSASIEQTVRAVRTIQENARTLGLVGGAFLLWSSLSLFSALESAFNIVYDRPNRPFLRGKALALGFMLGLLVVLFVGLVSATFGIGLAQRHAPEVVGDGWVTLAISLAVSGIAVFLFLFVAYFRLTNARLSPWEVLPGAVVGTVVLLVTFQFLPLFTSISRNVVSLQVLGTGALLIVWLYVLANVIVFGAELNWQLAYGRHGLTARPKRPEASETESAVGA